MKRVGKESTCTIKSHCSSVMMSAMEQANTKSPMFLFGLSSPTTNTCPDAATYCFTTGLRKTMVFFNFKYIKLSPPFMPLFFCAVTSLLVSIHTYPQGGNHFMGKGSPLTPHPNKCYREG